MIDEDKAAVKGAKNLSLCEPAEEMVLEVDASMKGLCACLMQGVRIISFASKSLTSSEANYSNIQREYLAVVFGLEHFKAFCYWRPVSIFSDNKPLEAIF